MRVRGWRLLGALLGYSMTAFACNNTMWSSSVVEVLQIGLCTPVTCTFTFTESSTGASISGTFSRPTSGFMQMTVITKSLGTATGWAFTGSTLYAVEIPGAGLVSQPLIAQDFYNPVIFVSKSCPTGNFRSNWIFNHWDSAGANDVNSASQAVGGYFDSRGTTSLSLSVRDQYELTGYASVGPVTLTPTAVACSGGTATISNGTGDRSGKVYYGGSSGVILYKTDACHSAFGVPQNQIGSMTNLVGSYSGFAYDTKQNSGFDASGASVHQVKLTVNAAGCTSASKCTGNGLTSAQGTDTTYLNGGFSLQVNAVDLPRLGMFEGVLYDGSGNQGNVLCTVARNLKTTNNTPPYYQNIFCVAQTPSSNADPLNFFLVSVPQAPATADTATFGGGSGYVTTNISNADLVNDVALQSDGKILAAGSATLSSKTRFSIARYTNGGVLDSGYGTAGSTTTDILTGADAAKAVVVQSDDKAVLVGQSKVSTAYDLSLARYNTDGSLDTTYGTNGIVTSLPTTYKSVEMQDARLLPNDMVLAAGACQLASNSLYGFCLARFYSDGTLDTSFGTNGYAFLNMASSGQSSYGMRARVLSTGKIVMVGRAATSSSNTSFAIARFNANGTVDTTFHSTGSNTVNIGSYQDTANAVGVLSDGSYVIGGQQSKVSGNTRFAWSLAKFSSAGALDTTFGTSGIVTTTIGSGTSTGDNLYDIAVQTNDKILAVGNAYSSHILLAVTRYSANGALDTTFNSTGKWTLAVGSSDSGLTSILLQPDGRAVMGGYTTSSNTNYLVYRMWP